MVWRFPPDVRGRLRVKIDRIPARARVPLVPGIVAACAASLLSGCMSGPTYGTGKSANAQLLSDLTGVVSTETMIANQGRGSEIAYTPRAEIVRPASLEVLPEPQQALASSGNPAWPESPEQRRARIRAEATANRDDVDFRPVVDAPRSAQVTQAPLGLSGRDAGNGFVPAPMNLARTKAPPRQKKQGDPNFRRYLSEPPVDYRVPSDNAPVGELGEDEWKKEQSARRGSGKSSWRDYVPGL